MKKYYIYKYNNKYDHDEFSKILKENKIGLGYSHSILGLLEMELGTNILCNKNLLCYIEFDENEITEDEIIELFSKNGIDLLTNEKICIETSNIDKLIKSTIEKSNQEEEYIIDFIESREDLINFDTIKDNFNQIYEYLKRLDLFGNTLLITDPYIFPHKHFSWYETGLIDLFIKLNPKKIITHCYGQNLCNKFFNKIKSELKKHNIELDNVERDDYHDRFWICEEKKLGIVIGISLNYEKIKKAYINNLDDKDVDFIVSDLKNRVSRYLEGELVCTINGINQLYNSVNFSLFKYNTGEIYIGHMEINGNNLQRANGDDKYKEINIYHNSNNINNISPVIDNNNIYIRYYVDSNYNYLINLDMNTNNGKIYCYKDNMDINKENELVNIKIKNNKNFHI